MTVVGLCQNTANYLIEGLTILTEAYSSEELQIICIDDCSNDRADVARLSAFCGERGIELIQNKAIRGIPASLNIGLAKAKGEVVSLLGDDLILPSRLAADVATLRSAPASVALVHSVMQSIDQVGNRFPDFVPCLPFPGLPPEKLSMDEIIRTGGFVASPTVTFRTACLRAVGGWDEDLEFEDLGMWFKLNQAGYSFRFRPDVGTLYRKHPLQHSSRWDYRAIHYRFSLYSKYSMHSSGQSKLDELLMVAAVKHLDDQLDMSRLLEIYRESGSPNFFLANACAMLVKIRMRTLRRATLWVIQAGYRVIIKRNKKTSAPVEKSGNGIAGAA